MPSITASVTYGPEWDRFRRQIAVAPAELERTLRRAAPQIARPMADAVRQAQRGSTERMAQKHAPTTKATSLRGLPAIRTGGLPYTMGTEYGGGRRYATTTQPVYGRSVGPYKKHLTRQFRPHRGRAGYEIWPTIRSQSKLIIDAYSRAFDAAMKRVGLI